jgi:hypothetical protein
MHVREIHLSPPAAVRIKLESVESWKYLLFEHHRDAARLPFSEWMQDDMQIKLHLCRRCSYGHAIPGSSLVKNLMAVVRGGALALFAWRIKFSDWIIIIRLTNLFDAMRRCQDRGIFIELFWVYSFLLSFLHRVITLFSLWSCIG